MSDLRTFRLLQRAHPERAAIEQLMADERDEVLLGALANPDHSEASRRVLRELVDARGLHGEEDDGWALSQASLYVAPFGPRLTFDEALAAPGRRRRLPRIL